MRLSGNKADFYSPGVSRLYSALPPTLLSCSTNPFPAGCEGEPGNTRAEPVLCLPKASALPETNTSGMDGALTFIDPLPQSLPLFGFPLPSLPRSRLAHGDLLSS